MRLRTNPIIEGLLIIALFSTCSPSAIKKSKPNVLMIVVDDMNDYGYNNAYPLVKTPYLDKLAEESINFKNAACNSPVCNPSRSSFFSGLHPHTTGAYLNGSNGWNRSELLKEIKNIPEWFKLNGYTTWGRGKLLHNPLSKERERAMWDNKHVYKGGFGPFPEKEYWHGNSKFRSIKGYDNDTVFPDVKNANAAIEFLNKEHEKPFFMCYGLWRPHSPYTAPQRFFDMYNEADFDLSDGYRKDDLDDTRFLGQMLVDSLKNYRKDQDTTDALLKKFLYAYAANTSFTDWNVGRVIEALDQSKYAKNTIVIFFSDNGFHCGEKERWGKATLWDKADIVPMLVRTPGKKGAVSKATISLIDIYPTLLEYCNVPKPDQPLDGNSFTTLLKDPQAEWNIPSFTSFGIKYSSVRNEKFRYIQYPDGTEELYNHLNDPHEFTNVADNPEMEAVKQELAKHIPESWAESTGGRLEVHRDFDVVKRVVNKYHNHYEKYMKEQEAKK